MKKIILLFILSFSSLVHCQELMNCFIEPSTTNNAVELHTVVYRNMYSFFDAYSISTIDNIVTVTLCYYNTSELLETTDLQNIEINLPTGYSNFTIHIEVYGDNDAVAPCSLDNLVDAVSIDFDFPYNPIEKTTIPDDHFENHLEILGFGDDLHNNDLVFTHRIINIKHLFLPNSSIANMEGIDKFTILKDLSLGGNLVTAIDLSSNILLERLFCHSNPISQLDVSNNILLKFLICGGTDITNLNLTNNVDLKYLDMFANNITSIDLTQNINLLELSFSGCQISMIDLSNNLLLEFLDCSSNLLSSLDVSSNINLRALGCSSNQITSLDLNNNPNLQNVLVGANNLSFLSLKNGNNTNITNSGFTAYSNPDLTCIFVDDAEYSATNWTNIDPASTFVETQAECDALGMEEEIIENDIQVYPNPTDETLNFRHINEIEIINAVLYNYLGNVITRTNRSFMDVSELKTGIYILRIITTNNELISQRVIIEND